MRNLNILNPMKKQTFVHAVNVLFIRLWSTDHGPTSVGPTRKAFLRGQNNLTFSQRSLFKRTIWLKAFGGNVPDDVYFGVLRVKRWLSLALKFALSAFLVGFLLDTVDLEQALTQLAEASPLLMLAGTLVLLFQMILNTLRWQSVLRALDASLGFVNTFKIVYIGIFFNQTLPSSVGGDAVRMYKAYKSGLSLSASVNGVMLERLATVLALLWLVVIFQPFLLERTNISMSAWVFPVLAVLGVLGTGFIMFLDRLPEGLRRWRLVRGLAYLATDTRLVFLQARHTLPIIAISMVGHVNVSLCMWVLGLSLGLGDQLNLIDCLVIVPSMLLITTLPISIAGWGVREGVMVAALGFIGISTESALLLSILFGLVVVVTALPGGLIWLASSNHSLPKDGDLILKEDKI